MLVTFGLIGATLQPLASAPSSGAQRAGMSAGVRMTTGSTGCGSASSGMLASVGGIIGLDGSGAFMSARVPDDAPGSAVDGSLFLFDAEEPPPEPTPSPEPTPPPAPTPSPTPSPTPTPTPTPKPTPWPTPPGVTGLDVSHWNGYPDFEQLYASGMRFVFSKATQGTTLQDTTYRRHTREARAAGLEVGAYHFFDYRKDGTRQAQYFLDYVRAQTSLDGLLPLVVDVECLSTLGPSDHTSARTRLHAMMDELYRQTGRYPMIYTSRHMWQQVVGAPRSFGFYPLWVACWKCDTLYMPNGWDSWLFWQVGQFRFPGIGGLDGNVFDSTRMSDLRAQRQRPVTINRNAQFAPEVGAQLDLRGADGREVRVAVGDGSFGSWEPFARSFDFSLADGEGESDGSREVRAQLRSARGVRSPIFSDDIVLDTQAPSLERLAVSMAADARVPRSGARVPALAGMAASDATSGLDRSVLAATCGGRQRASVISSSSTADLGYLLDLRGCDLEAKATDLAGHVAARRLADLRVGLADVRNGSQRITLSGKWVQRSAADALRKTLLRASKAGARVTMTFDGSQVAIVAQRGPNGGRAEVIIDGQPAGTIDLYAPSKDVRRIVFLANVRRGEHVISVRVLGTGRAASSGSVVKLDAFLVLDRRR